MKEGDFEFRISVFQNQAKDEERSDEDLGMFGWSVRRLLDHSTNHTD